MFETERLVVRAPLEDDLDALLAVYLSNPGYLQLTEGSAGEPGRYDRGMLERDLAVAALTPGRHVAGLFDRETGEGVGVLDWLEEHPSDGRPWIGLLIIRADRQREGLAAEALAALAEDLRARGAAAVRAAVARRNETGAAFLLAQGFRPVSETVVRLAAEEPVTVLELELQLQPG